MAYPIIIGTALAGLGAGDLIDDITGFFGGGNDSGGLVGSLLGVSPGMILIAGVGLYVFMEQRGDE